MANAQLVEIPAAQIQFPPAPSINVSPRGDAQEIDWTPADQKPARLLFAQPIQLSPATERIALRCKALTADPSATGAAVFSDADGRLFTATLQGDFSTRGWQRLDTQKIGGEIRSASQGSRSWNDITSPPKAPFSLVGLDLSALHADGHPISILLRSVEIENVPRNQFPGYWGVFPASASTADSYFEFTDSPVLYEDRLFTRPGSYHVILTAQSSFQGPIVWSRHDDVTYDSAQETPALSMNLPRGYYWITARVFDSSGGNYLFQRSFQLDVERRGEKAAAIPEPTPLSLVLDLQGTSPQNVFPPGETPVFHVRLPATPAGAVLEYRVETYDQVPVIPVQTIPAGGKSMLDLSLPTDLIRVGKAYQLKARLLADGKVLDENNCLFGYRNPVAPPPAPQPPPTKLDIPGPLHMATGAFWQPARLGGAHYPMQEVQDVVDLAARHGFSCFSIGLTWSQVEPLPGVYRFDEIDQQIAMAKKAGLKVCLELAGFADLPQWMRNVSHLSDEEGQVHNLWFRPGASLEPSPIDPFFLRSLQDVWQRLSEHYHADPSVVGYTFSGLFADHFYLRYPGPGLLSRDGFQAYLRTQDKDSLADLNHRWNTDYTAWNQINLPAQSQDIHRPDFSPPWVDYVGYTSFVFQNYVKTVVEGIRSFDDKSWIQLYWSGGADTAQVLNYLKAEGGFPADGGDEQEDDLSRISSVIPLRHLPEITESVLQMPRNRFNIDMIFTRLIYGGLGAYYRCLWNMAGAHNAAAHKDWLDCVDYLSNNWKPILEQVKNTRPPPLQVGVFDSQGYISSFLHSYEAGQSWPAGSLNEALLNNHLLPLYIDDYAPLSVLKDLKLLIVNPNTQRLSLSQLDALVNWTQAGGHLVLFASSGRWVANRPDDDFVLPRRLGISLSPSGNRLHEAQLNLNAGGPFQQTYQLPLYGSGLDGYAGFEALVPQGTFDTLATFSNGSPAVIQFRSGKGDVVLFLQSIDWHLVRAPAGTFSGSGIFDDLLHWAGASRYLACDQSQFRVALLKGATRDFLLVHRFMPYGTHNKPTQFNLDQPKLDGTVRVLGYPAATSYRLAELTRQGGQKAVFTSDQLSTSGAGVSGMALGETRVFSLQPAQPGAP
jgi:hypothetical protein